MNEYSWNLDQSPSIAHFGILGMRWGVRRYQNADGTYTSAGKDRYFDGHDYVKQKGGSAKSSGGSGSSIKSSKSSKETKQSDAYLKDVAKAKANGKSQEEAEAIAERNRKIRKAVAITAGVAVAAAVTYVGVKYYKNNIADTIMGTASTPLKRVQTFDGKNNLNGTIFAADAKDNARYIDWWGKQQKQVVDYNKMLVNGNFPGIDKSWANKDVYNMDIVFNKGAGTKVASTPHAKKIFNKMVNEDAQFKASVEKMIKDGGVQRMGANDLYEKFNINMAGEGRKSEAAEKFFKAMKERGYGGIKDINDNKYSGYDTKSAAILFGGDYDWSAHKLSDLDFSKAAEANKKIDEEITKRVHREVIAENIVKNPITIGSAAAAGAGIVASKTKTARATSMRNAGVPVSKIAKQLGIPESEVYALTSDSKK